MSTLWAESQGLSGESAGQTHFEFVERLAFYERAKKADVVVAPSEKALYANIILKKGVL